MEYVVGCFVAGASYLVATFIVKSRKTFWREVLYNVVILLACGILMLVTGIQETSFLIYVLLLALTLTGILMRILMPMVVNCVTGIFARYITKKPYKKRTYDQMFQESKGQYSMFNTVCFFTALKVLACIGLILASFKLI